MNDPGARADWKIGARTRVLSCSREELKGMDMKHSVKRLPRESFDKKTGADIRLGDVLSDWHESTEGEPLVAVAGLVTEYVGQCDQGRHVKLNGSVVGCYDRAGAVLILRRDA